MEKRFFFLNNNHNKSSNRLNQTGGERNIPLFKPPAEGPFVPPEQRVQDAPAYQAGPKPPRPAGQGGMNPIVNLQVYQPPKPKPRDITELDINKLDASMFMPTYMANPFFPPQYGLNNSMMAGQIPVAPTIVKNYTINAPGPVGMHEKISYIYEDMLPTINIPGKITTLNERNTLQHYLRSILFPRGDGQDINLDERSNSLMQHLKYMDMNPYNTYDLEQNPYKSLPNNFIIYRTCYPIIRENGTTKCAKNSTGMNLRIYNLENEAYNVGKGSATDISYAAGGTTATTAGSAIVGPVIKLKTDFEQWREIEYYRYIRDHILKKNICPNFVNLYGYFINEKSNIDFNKITAMRAGISKPHMPTHTMATAPTSVPKLLSTIASDAKITIPAPDAFEGKALIALTESPLYNILGFASTIYKREGPVKKMLSTGFYNENIWFSLIFQIMVALAILQREGIYFNNFEIDHNVFIKDISLHSNLTNFWKYIIDGIEYYIPNYGFIAMIDSNYRDELIDSTINKRIYSARLGDSDKSEEEVKNLIFNNMFLKALNPQNFKDNDLFLNRGGVTPPPSIMTFLGQIQLEGTSNSYGNDIFKYIKVFMTRFVNNRIGTILKDSEISNIRRDDTDFKVGRIVVQEVATDTYKFVLITEVIGENVKILTDRNSVEKEVTKASLIGYSKLEKIEQQFKANEVSLSDDDLLETYIV